MSDTTVAPAPAEDAEDAPTALDTSAMEIAGRDDLLTEKHLNYEDVPIERLGKVVRVRELESGERDQFEDWTVDYRASAKAKRQVPKMADFRAKLLVLSIIGADGARLYNENDIKPLSKQPAAIMDPLFAAATRLSGMRQEDIAELAEGFGESPDAD